MGAGESRRRRLGRSVAIQLGGVVVTLALWAALTFAFGFIAFGTSVCGTATASEVRGYRLALGGYGLFMTVVPLAIATLVRYIRELAWPWFAVGVIVAVVAAISCLSAQPPQWCF